jgi:pimeloyl-ACP methyl ester carboxylesterase
MPRTPKQNEQLRADSERRLLDAASATFARLGVERATVRDIAEGAGATSGSSATCSATSRERPASSATRCPAGRPRSTGSSSLLLVWGMKDPAFGPSYLDRWQREFSDATSHAIADCGHFVPEEAPAAAGEVIELFLEATARHAPA